MASARLSNTGSPYCILGGPTRSMIFRITGSDFFRWRIALRMAAFQNLFTTETRRHGEKSTAATDLRGFARINQPQIQAKPKANLKPAQKRIQKKIYP